MVFDSSEIISIFLKASSETFLCDKWIKGEDLCVIVSNIYNLKKDHFTMKKLIKALNTKEGKIIKYQIDSSIVSEILPNHIGIFRQTYRPKKRKNMKREGCTSAFYFVSTKGTTPPLYSDAWYNHIVDFLVLARLVTKYKKTYFIKDVAEWTKESNHIDEISTATSNNKKCTSIVEIQGLNVKKDETNYDVSPVSTLTIAPQQQIETLPPSPPVSYWTSPEAALLFRPLPTEEDSLVAVQNQIETLSEALESPYGLMSILHDDLDPESISQFQMHNLNRKVNLLHTTLVVAAQEMAELQNWSLICEKAIAIGKQTMGKAALINERTLRNWYLQFREDRKFKVNIIKKEALPPFLLDNLDIKDKIKKYARENLGILSIEFMSEYLHDIILPAMIKDRHGVEKTDDTYNELLKSMLHLYRLRSISPATIYRWLLLLGFNYKTRRKGYYVDGHERPATIQYRKAFIARYLSYEIRMHRWIQISRSESLKLEEDGIIPKGSGYHYDLDGEAMVEYHVDSANIFQERMNGTEYGGNLSV